MEKLASLPNYIISHVIGSDIDHYDWLTSDTLAPTDTRAGFQCFSLEYILGVHRFKRVNDHDRYHHVYYPINRIHLSTNGVAGLRRKSEHHRAPNVVHDDDDDASVGASALVLGSDDRFAALGCMAARANINNTGIIIYHKKDTKE